MVLDGGGFGAVANAASAIRWGHLQEGYQNPMENEFVMLVLEAAKRTVGKPVSQQKEGLTVEMAKVVVNTLGVCGLLTRRRTITDAFSVFQDF